MISGREGERERQRERERTAWKQSSRRISEMTIHGIVITV
jgi:hypothetical protein